ncbi:MAG: DUF5777 family beta-barrel protein [Sphingobacteriales bacterium]
MKYNIFKIVRNVVLALLFSWVNFSVAQDSTAVTTPKHKPVKGTFGGPLLIDNQTVFMPNKNALTMTIQHRFGDANLYSDMYGLFNVSSIRIAFNYTPISNVEVGFGVCSYNNTWDGNLKIALMRQSEEGGWPLSISYYGNMAVDTRDKSNFVSDLDRYSYFHEIMIARKITENFSAQVAPSLSYFNNVDGYYNSNGEIMPKMNNAHYAISFVGRYKVSPKMAIIADYDQPLTPHPTNNPHPNVAGGIEFETAGHSFQLFLSNFSFCVPQANNFFNQNDFTKTGNYLLGFNITRKFNL